MKNITNIAERLREVTLTYSTEIGEDVSVEECLKAIKETPFEVVEMLLNIIDDLETDNHCDDKICDVEVKNLDELQENHDVVFLFTKEAMTELARRWGVSLRSNMMVGWKTETGSLVCRFAHQFWFFEPKEIDGWFEIPTEVEMINEYGVHLKNHKIKNAYVTDGVMYIKGKEICV